jgi:hypothetical protein
MSRFVSRYICTLKLRMHVPLCIQIPLHTQAACACPALYPDTFAHSSCVPKHVSSLHLEYLDQYAMYIMCACANTHIPQELWGLCSMQHRCVPCWSLPRHVLRCVRFGICIRACACLSMHIGLTDSISVLQAHRHADAHRSIQQCVHGVHQQRALHSLHHSRFSTRRQQL